MARYHAHAHAHGPTAGAIVAGTLEMVAREGAQQMLQRALEGLSSGDFEPAFRELLGEQATLSGSTILRLKDAWAVEYETWRQRPIEGTFAHLWADGIYLGAGLEPESSCLLVVVGAREDGARRCSA